MVAIAFREPYQRVVLATGLSNVADGIRFVALPLLAVELTGSPFMLALVLAAGQAPWLIFGLWAGLITDRADRRALSQRVASVRVGMLLLLAILVAFDAVPIGLLIAASFTLGVSEVLADNVNSALIPSLVTDEDLERANSQMVGAEIAGNELLGPAAGGLLFAVAASLPFFTNASLLAFAFVLLAGLPMLQTSNDTGATTAPPPRLRDGIDLVRASPALRLITASTALLAAIDGAWFSLLALLVTVELGLNPAAFGLLLAAGAIGGLAGAALANRRPQLTLTNVCAMTISATALPLIGLSLFTTTVAITITLVLTSAAFALWNVFMVSARQRATPNDLLGRVGAAHRTAVAAAGIGGMLTGGILAETISIGATLAGSGAVLLLVSPVMVRRFHSLWSAGPKK